MSKKKINASQDSCPAEIHLYLPFGKGERLKTKILIPKFKIQRKSQIILSNSLQ